MGPLIKAKRASEVKAVGTVRSLPMTLVNRAKERSMTRSGVKFQMICRMGEDQEMTEPSVQSNPR